MSWHIYDCISCVCLITLSLFPARNTAALFEFWTSANASGRSNLLLNLVEVCRFPLSGKVLKMNLARTLSGNKLACLHVLRTFIFSCSSLLCTYDFEITIARWLWKIWKCLYALSLNWLSYYTIVKILRCFFSNEIYLYVINNLSIFISGKVQYEQHESNYQGVRNKSK